MSFRDIEFITTSDYNIKNESDIKQELSMEEQVDNTLDMMVSSVEGKCGEIFVSQAGSFILVCGYCGDRFKDMTTFGEHLQTMHLTDEFHVEHKHFEITNSLNQTVVEDFENSTNNNLCSDSKEKTDVPKTSESDVDYSQNSTSETLCSSSDSKEVPKTYVFPKIRIKVPKNVTWTCEICDREYNCKASLVRHNKINRHKKRKPKPSERKEVEAPTEEGKAPENNNSTPDVSIGDNSNFLCEICNRQYETFSKFRAHATHHGDLVPRLLQQDPTYLRCRYCFEEFTNRRSTLDHEQTHGQDSAKRFQCTQCPKTFTSNWERTEHLNIHTGETPFKCTMCPRSFPMSRYLKKHIRRHLNVAKYVCDICGMGFHRNVDHEIHMRKHTGEKPYQCEECGMSFVTRRQLYRHQRRHEKIPPYKCEICDKGFYTTFALKSHEIVHTNDRPFKCSECGRTFSRKKTLACHRKIHSNKKQYVCGICGKEFSQHSGLYAHKKSHGEKMVGLS